MWAFVQAGKVREWAGEVNEELTAAQGMTQVCKWRSILPFPAATVSSSQVVASPLASTVLGGCVVGGRLQTTGRGWSGIGARLLMTEKAPSPAYRPASLLEERWMQKDL